MFLIAVLTACGARNGDAATNAEQATTAKETVTKETEQAESGDAKLCVADIRDWNNDDGLMSLTASGAAYDPEMSTLMFEQRISETQALAAEVDDSELQAKINAAAEATQALSDAIDPRLSEVDWLIAQRTVMEAELAVITHCYVEYGDTAEGS